MQCSETLGLVQCAVLCTRKRRKLRPAKSALLTTQLVTVLHRTVLHPTALHCTALYCLPLYCTPLHCTALYRTAYHFTALHCTPVYVLHCWNTRKSLAKQDTVPGASCHTAGNDCSTTDRGADIRNVFFFYKSIKSWNILPQRVQDCLQ